MATVKSLGRRRTPQRQILRVTAVTEDGDGDWTVCFGDTCLTVKPSDLDRKPQIGDRLIVQLPMVIGVAE